MNDRHSKVEVKCEFCGKIFLARQERVAKGQGRWCSMAHYKEWLKQQGSQRKNIGKENAIISWDSSLNIYRAYWYDKNMKYRSTPWARWYYELYIGEIPNGYYATYVDGDSKNISPENVCLKTMAEISDIADRVRGVPKSDETKKKLSIAHTGKILSEEHKKRIGDANRKKWAMGLFDKVHKGLYNRHWRGGVPKGYPKEFEEIRAFIRERDRYTCQICSKHLHKTRDSHVHHVDGNRNHNEHDNLILLCTTCHGRIHSNLPASPTILAFRSKLEWNKP